MNNISDYEAHKRDEEFDAKEDRRLAGAKYVIRNKRTNEHWSNIDGWVDLEGATVFTSSEKLTLNLPIDGVWAFLVQ